MHRSREIFLPDKLDMVLHGNCRPRSVFASVHFPLDLIYHFSHAGVGGDKTELVFLGEEILGIRDTYHPSLLHRPCRLALCPALIQNAHTLRKHLSDRHDNAVMVSHRLPHTGNRCPQLAGKFLRGEGQILFPFTFALQFALGADKSLRLGDDARVERIPRGALVRTGFDVYGLFVRHVKDESMSTSTIVRRVGIGSQLPREAFARRNSVYSSS
jgi:hypothetical protein